MAAPVASAWPPVAESCRGAVPGAVLESYGSANANVVPGPSFGTAQSPPCCRSMIARLTESPMPTPSALVV
jgi:hypothetical protein